MVIRLEIRKKAKEESVVCGVSKDRTQWESGDRHLKSARLGAIADRAGMETG